MGEAPKKKEKAPWIGPKCLGPNMEKNIARGADSVLVPIWSNREAQEGFLGEDSPTGVLLVPDPWTSSEP